MTGAARSIFPGFKTGSSSGVGGRSRFSRPLQTVKEREREPREREKARRELRCLSPAAVKAEEREAFKGAEG